MATRTPYTSVASEVLTSANFEKMPKGWIGWVETTTNTTGITTETDLTGMTVTVTVGANRMLRIGCSIPMASDTADDRVGVNIKESTTYLGVGHATTGVSGRPYVIQATAIVDGPSAGTHTYKVTGSLGGGSTGPAGSDHSFNGKSVLWVEDIGPSSS